MADMLLEILDALPLNTRAKVTIDTRTKVEFTLYVEDMATGLSAMRAFTREFVEHTDNPGYLLIQPTLKSMKEIEGGRT